MARTSGKGSFYKSGPYFAWKVMFKGDVIVRSAKTERALYKRIKPIQDAIAEGRDPRAIEAEKPKSMLTGEWLDFWLETFVHPPLKARSTYRQYEGFVRLYFKPVIGETPLSQLTDTQLQDMFNKLLRSGKTIKLKDGTTKKVPMSPESVKTIRRVLTAALALAKKRKLITDNPTEGTTPPSQSIKRKRVLNPEQAGKFTMLLLEEPAPGQFKSRFGPLILLLLSTGPRISEALGLELSDIIIADGKPVGLRIDKQLQWNKGEWELAPLKTAASYRNVPLSAVGRAVIEAQLRMLERDSQGKKRKESEFLFTTQTGQPLMPRNVQRAVDGLLESLDLPHVSLHDLRRTYGTLLARKQTPDHILKSLLGHSNISTTKSVYTIVLDPDAAAAVTMLDDILTTNGESHGIPDNPPGNRVTGTR